MCLLLIRLVSKEFVATVNEQLSPVGEAEYKNLESVNVPNYRIYFLNRSAT